MKTIDQIDFEKNKGLVPVVIQEMGSKQVLMLGYTNKGAFKKTLETGKVWFYSRSRKRLWRKGEKSGYFQKVRTIFLDCDNDTLLIQVDQKGGACHRGYKSCFFRKLFSNKFKIIRRKVFEPEKIYK